MPIATTGEVRNQGDEPLTRDELAGMARQIEERSVPVFADHGTDLAGMEPYSAVEKLGEWTDPETRTREEDDETALVATARLMDPDTLPDIASREYLGAIKEQVERDMSISSSIGWREDDAYPGGVDLMEASIVGIGADPRTTSQSAVVARAAVDAGADPDRLVATVRAAVNDDAETMTDDESTADDGGTTEEQDAGDGEQTREEMSAEEFRSQMLDLQRTQMDTLETLANAVREDDEDDDMDDDDDPDEEQEGEKDDEDDDDESEADTNTQSVDDDAGALRSEIADLRDELSEVRNGIQSGDTDLDTPDADDEQERDADDAETDDDTAAPAGPNWR